MSSSYYESDRAVSEYLLFHYGTAEETLPENYIHNKFLPFHPGAVRWFEENGYEIPDELKGS